MSVGELLPNGLPPFDMPTLAALIDAAPLKTWLLTAGDCRFAYANAEFLSFAGCELADLVDRTMADVLAAPLHETLQAMAAQVTAKHAPRWEGWVPTDGTPERYYEITMRPLATGTRLLAILVFLDDSSERKRRELELNQTIRELVETASLHRAMVASALDCIFLMDAEGTVVEFNPAAEVTFGYSRDEAVGKSIVELIVPPDVRISEPSKVDVFRSLMGRDAIGQAMKRNAVTKDGRPIAIELTVTLVDANGRELFMAHCRDITPQIEKRRSLAKSEAARLASEQVNTQIIASAIDGIVLVDHQGLIQDFNPAAEDMLGHRREDAIGKRLADMIIPHQHRAAHEAGMARYMATGVSRVMGKRLQLEALASTGELIPVEVTINEVKLQDTHLFTAHLRDLRESRRKQEEIDNQRARIHQIEKLSAMGSLLAGVAHELNNPLAILVAQGTLLKDKAATDEMRKRAERIHAAAERAGRIVKSFLSMARQKPPAREIVNINKLVLDTLEMLNYGLRTAGIAVSTELSPSVPEISIDGDLFRQVIANIVINAQQALLGSPEPRCLVIRTSAQGERLVLEIEDNGPGVPPDKIDRIFDPFFTTKPAGVGTGIGLSICKDVVQAHGGKLELGKFEGGALFRVTLPLGAADDIIAAPTLPSGGGGERILIIDDEQDVGESLAEILSLLGHATFVTISAREGLQMVAAEPFDRLFIDLRMPEMGGHDVLKEVARIAPALAARTVVVTGDTVRGPLELPSDTPVLEKPFSVDDVRALLEAVRHG